MGDQKVKPTLLDGTLNRNNRRLGERHDSMGGEATVSEAAAAGFVRLTYAGTSSGGAQGEIFYVRAQEILNTRGTENGTHVGVKPNIGERVSETPSEVLKRIAQAQTFGQG